MEIELSKQTSDGRLVELFLPLAISVNGASFASLASPDSPQKILLDYVKSLSKSRENEE